MSFSVFRGIKEGAGGPERASSPQNVSMQGNSTENCNSSGVTVGNNPRGKFFPNFQNCKALI